MNPRVAAALEVAGELYSGLEDLARQSGQAGGWARSPVVAAARLALQRVLDEAPVAPGATDEQ